MEEDDTKESSREENGCDIARNHINAMITWPELNCTMKWDLADVIVECESYTLTSLHYIPGYHKEAADHYPQTYEDYDGRSSRGSRKLHLYLHMIQSHQNNNYVKTSHGLFSSRIEVIFYVVFYIYRI